MAELLVTTPGHDPPRRTLGPEEAWTGPGLYRCECWGQSGLENRRSAPQWLVEFSVWVSMLASNNAIL
ncbi:hypothetical protein PoB_006810000 [Plakobranchus ocellatus]|uniref:Uncharacterized protein n=1 Tax=Plakobranchus ocellatus TaxID=259542 RepID=A0AAV4DCC5_9GAST|nr:hypothetical protein PoB_006810000 [Plakobranchus ocellatus]